MRQDIEVVLGDPDNRGKTTSIHFRVRDTPIARRYFQALRATVGHYRLRDPDRFYGFPTTHKGRPWIADELNRRIDEINAYRPGTIPHRAAADMSQSVMNALHLEFERMRGGVLTPAALYRDAPPEVQDAICDYNLLIHRYESRVRDEERMARGMPPSAHAVMTFVDPRPRYALLDDDYRQFGLRQEFGNLRINYCEVGKPLWDAFIDRDEHIGDENIRPLRWYSADALMQFSPTHTRYQALRAWGSFHLWWLRRARRRLHALGFRPFDPRNALGHITVADLVRDRGAIAGLDEPAIVDHLGQHQMFVAVICRDG